MFTMSKSMRDRFQFPPFLLYSELLLHFKPVQFPSLHDPLSAQVDITTMFTPLFHSLLKFYHLFPLHSPITLLYMDAPWGKFAYNEQRGREGLKAWGDLDGNLAWAFMEIVSVSLSALSGRH